MLSVKVPLTAPEWHGNDPLTERYGAMPRYFFHIRDDDGEVTDTEGMELADVAAAKKEAAISAKAQLGDDLGSGRPVDHRRIVITAEDGGIIDVFPLRDLLN